MKNRLTYASLSMVLLLWGSAFPAIRAALTYYPPTHLAALRFGIAAFALFLLASAKGIRFPQRRDIPLLLLNGVVGVGFYNLLLNQGQLTVKAGAASLLVNTAPLWTLLWSILYLKEKPSKAGIVGLFISFVGVLFIVMRQGQEFMLNKGAVMVIGASIAHSIYIVLMKRNVARYGAFFSTTYVVWAGALFLSFFSKGLLSTIHTVPLKATLTVVYLGLFPAATAYVFWGILLEHFPASKAVGFLYFVPVTAFLIAWIWLGEIPTWTTLIGGTLVLLGVSLIHREPR